MPVRSKWPGAAALAVAVLLWASFALTIRGIGVSGLTAADAAFLRFATPVLVLAAGIPRAVRAVRAEPLAVVAALSLAGLPHFLLSALGGSLTSAALVGLLLPGSVPLFVALLPAGRPALGRQRVLALGAIVAGITATAVLTTSAAGLGGIAVLLAAGLLWAVYTIALRHTRLDLISLVLLLCVPSALISVLLGVTGALPSNLLAGTVPLPTVALFAALQGIGTGIVSTLSYAYAVRRLGSGIPAVTGAISPVLTTLLAVPLFHEPITAAVTVALTLIVGGVLAFNLARSPRATIRQTAASV